MLENVKKKVWRSIFVTLTALALVSTPNNERKG